MHIKVKDFGLLLFAAYPIVGVCGMIQADNLLKVSHFVYPVPELSPVLLFASSLIYTALLTAFFFIMEGESTLFRFATLVCLSAVASGAFYVAVAGVVFLGSLPFGGPIWLDHTAAQPYFAVATVLAGVVGAVAFLTQIDTQDFREMPRNLAFAAQGAYAVFAGLILVVGLGLGLGEPDKPTSPVAAPTGARP